MFIHSHANHPTGTRSGHMFSKVDDPADELTDDAPLNEDPTGDLNADAATDETPEADATPDEGPGDDGEDPVLESFRLEDIEDPEVRQHVELYAKRLQGDYTRKTQTLAQQRKEIEGQIDLISALEDEETRIDALKQLADRYDLELDFEDDQAPDDEDDDFATPDSQIAALQARLDARDQAEADAARNEQETAYRNQVIAHVDDHLDKFAKARGLKDRDALPTRMRKRLIQNAAGLEVGEDGMPDMGAAISDYEAEEAELVQAYLKSKQAPTADLTGSSGQQQFNPSNERERLQMANAIVERAIARHA